MSKNTIRVISTSVLTLLIAAAVFALYRNGGSWLTSVREYTWTLNIPRLIWSVIILVVSLALTPVGWVMICRGMGSDIPAGQLFAAWYSSQLGRYIPGKIWLFAGRAGFLKTRGMNGARAAATTFYELFFTIASVGLVFLTAVFLAPDLLSGSTAKAAGVAAGSALLLLPLLHPVQKLLCRRKGIPEETLPSPSESIRITGFFTLLWAARGVSLYLLLSGTGIRPVELVRSLAAAPLSWLAGYIVIVVPGGVGVREAAAAALAAPTAVAPAAVAVAGQRVLMTLTEVLLALFSSKKIIPTGEDRCR